jgi:hypothetical protein
LFCQRHSRGKIADAPDKFNSADAQAGGAVNARRGENEKLRVAAIPKGLCPPAQGWRVSAYLGYFFGIGNNPNGVMAAVTRADENEMVATAWRLEMLADDAPG